MNVVETSHYRGRASNFSEEFGKLEWPTGTLPEVWPMVNIPEERHPASDDRIVTQANDLLDEAEILLRAGHWLSGMQKAHHAVWFGQRALTPGSWATFAKGAAVEHPVAKLIHEDPFTRRSFQKPRGYAGDAVLIDYIYGLSHSEHEIGDATPLGKWIYNYTSNSTAPRAVRRRMNLIAEAIDAVCVNKQNARILSVACGHMREVITSHAVQAGVVDEIVAFDQDPNSLEELERSAIVKKLRLVEGSVRRLIVGQYALGEFDLAYASGLYDYLDQRAAKRLSEVLYGMLKPGGTLIIANFLTNIYDIGYMESFMGWDLVFRTREQIVNLADGFAGDAEFVRYFEESEKNIGFLFIRKPL